MNSWSDLPNARLIDGVIASARQHPDAWNAAYDAAWVAAANADRIAAANAARTAAANAARCSILALVAYDDCARYLDMTADQVEVWAILSEDPAAVLLLPYVHVLERIKVIDTI